MFDLKPQLYLPVKLRFLLLNGDSEFFLQKFKIMLAWVGESVIILVVR